jgi:hypothetical protein
MGLFAVARLAERHRARVRLRSAAPQGLSALVWLPEGVVERTSIYGHGPVGGWQSQPVGAGSVAPPAAGSRPLGRTPEAAAALTSYGNAIEDDPYAEGPGGAQGWFRGRGGGTAAAAAAPDWSAARSGPLEQTSTGLPVRTPRTNLNSGAAPDSQAGLPDWADSGRGGPAPGSGTGTGNQTLPQQSPDQVRSLLAGFQRGTRRAETAQGQSPRAGEGSER